MTKEYEQRARIFQQAMKSCHSNNPADCVEWLADRIIELEEANKANEWHYVKDRDLPTDKTEKKYLVALKSEYDGFFYETDIWCETLHCFASNNPTKIYAWKEIVPPKELEKC